MQWSIAIGVPQESEIKTAVLRGFGRWDQRRERPMFEASYNRPEWRWEFQTEIRQWILGNITIKHSKIWAILGHVGPRRLLGFARWVGELNGVLADFVADVAAGDVESAGGFGLDAAGVLQGTQHQFLLEPFDGCSKIDRG
jgi:hypothetical protein